MPRYDSDSDDSYRSRSRRNKAKTKRRKSSSSSDSSSDDRSSSLEKSKPRQYKHSHSRERSKHHHKSSHTSRRRKRSRSSSSSDNSRSKSKKHTSKGKERSRRSKSKSPSRNRSGRSKKSRSASPKRSKTKESTHKKEKEPESSSKKSSKIVDDSLRDKLEAVIKAAAEADAQLRQKGLLTKEKISPSSNEELNVGQQITRAQAIDEINANSFTQKAFSSSRSYGKKAFQAIEDGEPVGKSTEPSAVDTNDADDDWKTNVEKLVHPNWLNDQTTSLDQWKKKLSEMRNRLCNGSVTRKEV